jgi:hypothetical protein
VMGGRGCAVPCAIQTAEAIRTINPTCKVTACPAKEWKASQAI